MLHYVAAFIFEGVTFQYIFWMERLFIIIKLQHISTFYTLRQLHSRNETR